MTDETGKPCPTCGYQIDAVDRLITQNARLRAALKPFAEVPPHSPPTMRCIVMDAGQGAFHFLQSDLDRAKAIYHEQAAGDNDAKA